MKQFVCTFFILISLAGYGQGFDTHVISLVPDSGIKEKFNESAYLSALSAKYDDVFRNQTSLNNFMDFLVESAKITHYSNYVYRGWEEVEAYLLQVLKKAAPENVVDPSIKIKIVRDAGINARCREDGTIFMNIGFLASFNTEAELGAVLCHELGHYLSFHSYKRFQKTVKAHNANVVLGMFRFGPLLANIPEVNLFHYLKGQEKEADDYAVKFFARNSYSMKGLVDAFDLLLKMDNLQKSSKGFKLPFFYLSSHPPTAERVNKMKKAAKNAGNTERHDFLVDAFLFYELKERAIDESIYLLFENEDYNACLYQAFLQNILHPQDEFYLFYTLESLRRLLAISGGYDQNYFISGNYKLGSRKPQTQPVIHSFLEKPIAAKTIFYHLKEIYPHVNFEKVDHPFLRNDTLEFATEDDALAYYQNQALSKCQSCFFSLKMLKKPYVLPDFGNDLKRRFFDMAQMMDSIKGKLSGFRKIPVFLNDIYNRRSGGDFNQLAFLSSTEIREDYLKVGRRKKETSGLSWKNPISNAESEKLFGQIGFLKGYYDASTGLKVGRMPMSPALVSEEHYEPVRMNISSFMPELAMLSDKYQYRKIIFFDLVCSLRTRIYGEGIQRSGFYQVIVYCLNLGTGQITAAKSKCFEGDEQPSMDFVLSSAEDLFLEMSLH